LKVGLLWRAEWDPPDGGQVDVAQCRLHAMFSAFAALGVKAEPVVYADDRVEEVHERLRSLDGVLVWVNPIEQGRDRSKLDRLLRTIAAEGVFVSAHPDVILRIGTKQVLVDTRGMGWGSDTRLYRSLDELRSGLPSRVGEAGRSCSNVTAAWEAMASGKSRPSTKEPLSSSTHSTPPRQSE
jgi:hypothetical protein